MFAAPIPRCVAFCIPFLVVACTTTITKTKNPEFTISLDSLAGQVRGHILFQHVNLDGKALTINGKDSSVLEIDIINGRQVPEDDEKARLLGRSIAVDVHNGLKEKSSFQALQVLFVKVDTTSTVTKREWKGFTYLAADL